MRDAMGQTEKWGRCQSCTFCTCPHSHDMGSNGIGVHGLDKQMLKIRHSLICRQT